MKNLKHLFVPYYLAVQLKEKGFDEKCLGYITPTGKTWMFDLMPLDRNGLELNPKYSEGILSPLYQQVVDWLNKEHELVVRLSYNGEGYDLFTAHDAEREGKYFETQDEAIKEALKLI